jgi:hypothetical protein
MTNKSITGLTLTMSVIFGLGLGEFMASQWLSLGNIASVCPNWQVDDFARSRGFSLENAFYEPMSSIDHCQPELKYTYHIDQSGFRNSPLLRTNPTILAVGDSFTFGFGVKDEEAFPALVGAHNAGMWVILSISNIKPLKGGLIM